MSKKPTLKRIKRLIKLINIHCPQSSFGIPLKGNIILRIFDFNNKGKVTCEIIKDHKPKVGYDMITDNLENSAIYIRDNNYVSILDTILVSDVMNYIKENNLNV
jgi:hypothetical protein